MNIPKLMQMGTAAARAAAPAIKSAAQSAGSAIKAATPTVKNAAQAAAPTAKTAGKVAGKVLGGATPWGAAVTGGMGLVGSAADYDYSKDLGTNIVNDLGESVNELATDVGQVGEAGKMIASGDIAGGVVKGAIAGLDVLGKGSETVGKVVGNVAASTGVIPHAGEVAAETTDAVHGTDITGAVNAVKNAAGDVSDAASGVGEKVSAAERIGEAAEGSNVANRVEKTAGALASEPTGLASAAADVAGWGAGSKVYNTLMSAGSGTVATIGTSQSVAGLGGSVSGTSSAPAASLDDPSDSGSASKASAAQTAQASAPAADNTVSAAATAAEASGSGITQDSVATGAERAAAVAESSRAAGRYTGTSDDAMRASGIDQRTINREKIARGREIMGLQ